VVQYIESIDQILNDPTVLHKKSLEEVRSIIEVTPNWRSEFLGKGSRKGKGWVLREYNDTGMRTGRMIRWHPGGGRHGPGPYWRVNNFQMKSPIIPAG
jgi:hypothetical protein